MQRKALSSLYCTLRVYMYFAVIPSYLSYLLYSMSLAQVCMHLLNHMQLLLISLLATTQKYS